MLNCSFLLYIDLQEQMNYTFRLAFVTSPRHPIQHL